MKNKTILIGSFLLGLCVFGAYASGYVFDREGNCRASNSKGHPILSHYEDYRQCSGQYGYDPDGNCRARDYAGRLVYTYYVPAKLCETAPTRR